MSLPLRYLVKGAGLVGGLAQGLKQRKVQALVLCDVVAHCRQQDQVEKALGHFLVEVGHKDARRFQAGVWGPVFGIGEQQHLR